MDLEHLRTEIDGILNPEPEEKLPWRNIPHPRLGDVHGLDTSYLETVVWEGSTIHPHTRLCPADEHRLHTLTRNSDVPSRLFDTALRLFGDSIITYFNGKDRRISTPSSKVSNTTS